VTVLAEEIVTLRSGRYDTEVPFTDRGDESRDHRAQPAGSAVAACAAARGVEARARIEQAQKLVVERLAVALQTVAGGDLDPEDRQRVRRRIRTLRESFNETVDTFVRVIEQMARNADTIRSSAEGIALSSDDLSARTENQAASLEETAAALNMITSNVETRPSARRTWSGSSSTPQARLGIGRSRAEDGRCDVADRGLVETDLPHHLRHRRDRVPDEPSRPQRRGRGRAGRRGRARLLRRRQRGAGAGAAVFRRRQRDQGPDQRQFRLRGTGRRTWWPVPGQRAESITESVSTISGHVEGISSSARDQSASLAEVNTGVAQLDRVTQQNAAMVSQANDAGRTLRDEANGDGPKHRGLQAPGR
jgi:methyl-accepting chemotaxis protein